MSELRFVLTRSRGSAAPPPSAPLDAPPPAKTSCGCGGGRKLDNPPVSVNGVEIDPEAIAREMQNHPSEDPTHSWREAARALVVRELLLTQARRLGLQSQPQAVAEDLFETDEESLIRELLDEAVEPAEPSDDELRRVYAGLQERFVTPTLYEAAHILFEPSSDDVAGWAQAEAEAQAVIVSVGDDPQAFAAAATRSACPTGAQGGSLGQVRRGELATPVQAAIETLADGKTAAKPIRSRFGWHVVRLERRIEGRALPFEVVEPRLRDMLEARAWSIGAAQYVADLAAQAVIEGVELAPPDAGFSACEEGRGC